MNNGIPPMPTGYQNNDRHKKTGNPRAPPENVPHHHIPQATRASYPLGHSGSSGLYLLIS
jgi:hypothetical protein